MLIRLVARLLFAQGRRRHRLLLVALVAASVVGCNGGAATKSVTGTITYQNKPVASGIINFLAAKSRPLGGAIESDGTYSVKLPPGQYQVRVDAPAPLPAGFKEGMPMPTTSRLVPEKYANFTSSGLTATISDASGSQQVDFKLP
jgi:hypothetical protein